MERDFKKAINIVTNNDHLHPGDDDQEKEKVGCGDISWAAWSDVALHCCYNPLLHFAHLHFAHLHFAHLRICTMWIYPVTLQIYCTAFNITRPQIEVQSLTMPCSQENTANLRVHCCNCTVVCNLLLSAFAMGGNELDWILWCACSPIWWHMMQKRTWIKFDSRSGRCRTFTAVSILTKLFSPRMSIEDDL